MNTHGLFLSGSQETLWLHTPVASDPTEQQHQAAALDILEQEYAQKIVATKDAYLISCNVQTLSNLAVDRIGSQNIPNAISALAATMPVRNELRAPGLIMPTYLSNMSARFSVYPRLQAWLDSRSQAQIDGMKREVEPALGQPFPRHTEYTPRGKFMAPEINLPRRGVQRGNDRSNPPRTRVPIMRTSSTTLQPTVMSTRSSQGSDVPLYELSSSYESNARITLSLMLGVAALCTFAIRNGVEDF